jgi:hypothetical protein
MRFRRLSVLVVLAASAAFAATIPVNNPSFENSGGTLVNSCGGNCIYGFGVPQWSIIGAAGILQPGTPDGLFNSIPDGQNVAYTDSGTVANGRIYQAVGTAAIPGVTYTLQVDFGWEFNRAYATPSAALVVGGNPVFATGSDPTQGNWSTFTAIYHAGVSDNGHPIQIVLGMSGGTEAVFDNVRLSANLSSPTPEPTSLILLGSGLGLVPLLRRRLLFGGLRSDRGTSI